MTHLYPAEMVTRLRRLGAALPPTVFIATDYTCIPFTEETECGHLAIPSEKLVKEYTRRGIPREKLWITGIPTHPCFREPCRETMKKRQQDGVNGQAARTIEEYLVREERTNG